MPMKTHHSTSLLVMVLTLTVACYSGAVAAASTSGTFIASNCAPVAAASDGTMVWSSRNSSGLWDAYIGNAKCQGAPLLAPYAGNRGPADITADGRYVLLTTAVGWERQLLTSAPGAGSQNAIQLYDRQTGKLSTLLAGGTGSRRGVIWPKFNADGTKIVWSQMLKTALENHMVGQWALHVADVNLAKGTLSNNVEWQDPNGQAAFYETYGWIPSTDLLIFMSTTRATSAGWGSAQLFTLPDELNPNTAPRRISPQSAPAWPWQSPTDAYHEFAHFAPNAPYTLYTSIGTDTVGGDDLFSYDMRTQGPNGLVGQPTRISYFGGDMNLNWGTKAISGWPQPAYTVITTMAWVGGEWVAATCPDMLCTQVNAWRITLAGSVASTPQLARESSAPPTSTPGRATVSEPGSASPRHATKARHRACAPAILRRAGRSRCPRKARRSSRRQCSARRTRPGAGAGRARKATRGSRPACPASRRSPRRETQAVGSTWPGAARGPATRIRAR
jgi:hypothetical protein